MDRPRDLLLFLLLLQIGTKEVLGHSNEGEMGDIKIKCPSGAFFYQGYCFMVGSVPMTWEDAMTSCLRSGMYLSWIEDAIENNYVATHAMSRVSQYWIGLSNMSSTAGQNEIVWTQYRMMKNKAMPLVEGLWKNLQPSEFVGDSQCVSTLRDKDDNHWTVTNCRKKLPFVCKVLGAPKSPDSMYCGNGAYINQKWQCDGQNDCGDMSDEVNCSSSCTELEIVQNGVPGIIKMIDKQTAKYKNDALCTWTLKAPIGVRIKVTINSTTDLEENADVLSVWTGGITLKESNFLGSVTGRPGKQEFYSQNNYLILQLSMDHSTIKSGFTADYETVAETSIWNDVKMLNASSSWQTLESPVYGQAVPFGLQLEWLITAESYTVVSLEFTEVDLPSNGSLKVYDGEDLMAPLVFSITKTPEHPFYISQSKTVRIVLSTKIHEYGKYRGVQLKYKEGCMLEMKQEGTIYSPGYQINSYPSNVTCTWLLTRNSGETRPISLRFTDFKLKLNSDYVEIYNDTAGTALHTGSGLTGLNTVSNTDIFSSTDGHLNVTFKSNLVLVEKGFRVDFSIDCPMLSISQWTVNSVSGKYTALNTVITLSCQTGYSFKQEEYNKESSLSLKCLSGGKWNVTRIPDCQITYCGTPPAIQNGILKNATGPRFGDNATYECNGGFTMNVSPTIKCQANGMWETPPVCNAQQCSQINPPTNGQLNVTAGSGTDYASVLMFSCDPGYDLVGSVYVHCRSNGTWSHSAPTCQKIKCPIPQVMYGKVEAAGDVEFEGTAKLKCDTGFIVNGTSSSEKDVTCGNDGQFSDLDPCINDDECSRNSCQFVRNTECIDTIGSYVCKCNSGFGRSGDSGNCDDIIECENGNGGCSQKCNNYVGFFNCSCNPGYQLYTGPNFNNISLAEGETGTRAGDKIRINYTCVRAQCPTPMPPLNGTILSNKQLFYYEDEITVECDHGYYPDPQRTTLKCGVAQGVGKWSTEMTNCTKGTCKIPDLTSDPNYNRIFPNDSTTVNFGTPVIIECRYGTKFRNLSLYCGENAPSNYSLLGDNLNCPVIDCGVPEQVPGADTYSYSDSLFGSSFNFSCQNGSTLSGKSVDGDYTVRCQENRQWGFGNLTCTGGRCTDPGTPGGAVQVVRSYEAGELLRFRCTRQGYEPVPSMPLLCVEQGNKNATWNSTDLPLCTDVTPPEFNNCPKTYYIDSMDAVSFDTPTATDNSGLVKNVTVYPPNFKSGTVVIKDLNVTYTAVDNGGNTARCTISFVIKDREKPNLICTNIEPVSINTTEGTRVDLQNYFSDPKPSENITFSPGRYITVDTTMLGKPLQINGTLQNMWGIEDTCTLLIYTKAEICFTESLSSDAHATKVCLDSNGNKTCTYTCESGYLYFDGSSSKMYTCSGMNQWSPSMHIDTCLLTESPSYKAKLEVVYGLGDLPASQCLQGFDNSLAVYNTTIAQKVDDRCDGFGAGKFKINNFTSTTKAFQITAVFSGEFTGSGTDAARSTCLQTLVIVVNNIPSNFLHSNTVVCDGGTPSNLSVISIRRVDAGNKCSDNMVLIKPTSSGSSEQCVMCPPGRYFNGTSCVMCLDGQFQDSVGKASCNSCPANTVSNNDKTACTDLCPPGFTSSDGMTECKPCGRDEYWVNATNCERCPTGYKTDVLNGVPDISGCKAPCPPGKYSLTGYEPCKDCPLHHYQTAEGHTNCTECAQNTMTLKTGSNNSAECVAVDSSACNTTLEKCNSQGKCFFQNHEAVCICDEGYNGTSCKNTLDICQSNPCFNGGTCVPHDDGFNCTCPSLSNCTMQLKPGSFAVPDAKSETPEKKRLDLCKEECLQDVQCKALYHTNGFCYIIRQDATPEEYTIDTALYFYKTCLFKYLYSGNQCETDLEDKCTPDTCSSHGMCQDRAGDNPVCLCPIVGEYSQPKCDLVLNLCDPNPCLHGAECRSWGAVRRQCICKPGYSGVNCSVNIDDCAVNTDGCLYNSTCKDGVDSYTCDCTSGFSGRHCQITKDFCPSVPACPNGGCVNDYSKLSPKCFCDYPYQLGNNGQCEKMNLCNNTDCNNGTCNSLTGKCTCDTGFEGSNCQHSVDDCKDMPCKNGSTCIDGHQDYSCVCVSGFTGKNCDMDQVDCPGSCNMTTTRGKVDKINECECLCKPGYTGQNCTEEIDECARFPCEHGATCTDMLNDYHCNCTEGWEGKNCDQQINYCQTTSTKCQSGDCYNLIDDKYCRCNAGTRGETCQDIPDVCNVISPCSATGTCQNANGTATCSCQNNYSGDSCQLLKDFCTGTTNCLYEGMPNTGTCTNLPAGGFNCACQTGYSGGTCQTKVTRCSNLNCGSAAMCNEEIGCYCPEGKILTENKVCKLPSDDFDIYFDTQMGEEGASTTAVLPGDPENSDLSFMMMVKFNKDQNVMEKEDAVLLRIRDFIEIKNNSITFMNGTSSHSVKFEYYGSLERIDDGTKWNFIAVSWRRDGKTTVYVKAGLLVFDSSSVAFKLPKVFNIEIGKRYGGRISQVKFWNSSIANADMLRLSSDRNHKPAGATLIQGWYNYKMNKGAMKKVTTQIENDSICDVPACSPSDKIKPKIKACPVDDARSSSKRVFEYQLPTISSMFDNFNESQSLISHKGSFTWGDYSLMFLAADENGNTAMCRSKLYVKYNADCPSPRKPPSLIIDYCSGSKDICKLSCPSNQVLSIPVPKYKMCSKLGVYTPLKPRQKFALPSCGGKTDTQIQIEVSLKFSLAVLCDATLEWPIERKLKSDFKDNVYQNWNNVCSDSDCSNVEISSKCVTGKEQMTVAMKIKNLRNGITKKSGSNTYTAKEVFRVLIFEDAVFKVDGVGGAVLLNDQVVITDIVSCPDGNMVIEGNCVECSNGTFYNSTSQNCEYCQVGTYGDEQGLTSCKSCGDGKTTLGVGNYEIADCVAMCPVGQFLNGSSCSLCQKHFYQDMAGQDYCLPCPLGKKTSGVGSNSSSQCFDDCKEGTELKPDGKCVACLRGYYRSFEKDVCTPCTAGMTTAGNGTANAVECVIKICYNGTYRNSSNVCVPCPVGEYQPMDLQKNCMKCPVNYTTKAEGKNNRSDCEFYCPAGYEVLAAANETCRPCPRGQYKNNTDVFSMCSACPSEFTTQGMKTTTIDECTIKICYNGTFRNSSNVCVPCPVGEYQPMDLQESCMKCPVNYITKSEGKNNRSDCEFYCPAGYEVLAAANETCRPCPRGQYKNNTDVFSRCSACPSGNTTENMKTTSINDCSINICSSGQEIGSSGGCVDCELDKYQSVDVPTSKDKCKACPSSTGTKQKMSNSSSDCLPVCSQGQFYNSTSSACEACAKGTWNNGNFTMKFEGCTMCQVNYTTTGPGMISEDNCTLLDCSPGSYISGSDCLPCDFATYQPNRHQTSCIGCGPDLNTSSTGATSAGDCQIFCPAGKEGQTVCSPCKEGDAKSSPGISTCTKCTGNYTANDQRTECDTLFCDVGFYFHQNSCIPCIKGFYKAVRGNKQCTKCPDGFLTTSMASVSPDDCNDPYCVPGKYINSTGQCDECMIGYYKTTTGNDNCTACSSNYSTPSRGSTLASNCSIIVCEAGEKRISSNNTCMKCPVGYYQPARGQSDCLQCPAMQTTEQEGTIIQTDCVPICQKGEEFNSVSKTCKKCDLGYYKSSVGNSESCTKCPDGNTTLITGSVSSGACNITDCLPGTYRSSGAGCKECPVGTFQDQKSQTSCKNCPSNKNTTETSGATSESHCIVLCENGTEYDRTSGNCLECPKDFYTNRSISQYCIKCPSGFITYGSKSSVCYRQPVTVTTAAPVVRQQTFIFSLTYRMDLDCNRPDGLSAALANIRARIIRRLIALASRFKNFCRKANVNECFLTLRVQSNACTKVRRKKRAVVPTDLDVKVDIPDVSSTVTDNNEPTRVLQTETMLKEDIDINKAQYTPEGAVLLNSKFEGKMVTCEDGSIPASNNETCVICVAGSYHDTKTSTCKNCSKNFYQDMDGKTTCKACPGSVKMYTLSEGSNSQSQCVSECSTNPSYCKNGGACNSNDVTIWCTCKERYTGDRCGEQAEFTSNTPYIIGGAVGGLAAIMVIALVIICLVRCLQRSKESKHPPKDPVEYAYDYNAPLYDNGSKRGVVSYARMNPSFNYDDGSFYDTRNRMYQQEDNTSAYRWQEAHGDYNL